MLGSGMNLHVYSSEYIQFPRQKRSPYAPWHGLWWIVVLMYTHVVHTSMSILNCPRLPGSDGNTTNVSHPIGALS